MVGSETNPCGFCFVPCIWAGKISLKRNLAAGSQRPAISNKDFPLAESRKLEAGS